MESYYRKELDRVETDGEFPASFQIRSTNEQTKWLTLNAESAQDLIDWLKERFSNEQKEG